MTGRNESVFSEDHVRLKMLNTIRPVTSSSLEVGAAPLPPNQIYFAFLAATEKPKKDQVRAMVLESPHNRCYEPVEYLIRIDLRSVFRAVHISAALGLHNVTPVIRQQLAGQLFTELPWQIATDMSVKEIF